MPHEAAGLILFGGLSPTRTLNLRTGRNWSAWQWHQVIRSAYDDIVSPAPREA